MRFLHTADWHLGRIFHNFHLTDDQAYVLEQFIQLARDVRPDAIVIAGDVYDRSVPPPEAVSLFDEVLTRLSLDIGVPVLVIAGNHDSPERLGFGDRVLARQNIRMVGQVAAQVEPVVLADEAGPVYFCPLPYAEPAIVRERLGVDAHSHEQALQAAVAQIGGKVPPGARRVAVAHAFVAGGAGSESERPLAVGAVAAVPPAVFNGFHYVALGHLHRPQPVGGEHIRYAGSLLKYSFDEAGHQKAVNLVELDKDGRVRLEAIALTPRRDVRCVTGYLEELLARGEKDANSSDYIAVTLQDRGPILDVIGKLRRVYPNVLQLERSESPAGEGRAAAPRVDHRRQSEADLFADFFRQATGQAMAEGEAAALARLLEEFYRREREVRA
ncbi:MAG TPA: exonuclease SbcCD subunit D [Selenomonadales bacterium]|nr:exonuclease SbcCD subunit D [Selenomonadales bacterium]